MKDMPDPNGGGPPGEDPRSGPAVWRRLSRALALLAVDPAGLGGLWLRARCGPVRDKAVALLGLLPLPARRLHPAIGDEALFGGIDLAETLAAGAPRRRQGLLARPATLVLPMAERAPAGLVARLAAALDDGGHCVVALDEGAEADEALAPALADRMAFHVDLGAVGRIDVDILAGPSPAAARDRLAGVRVPDHAAADLCRVAERLGVIGLRAPMLALRAARAHAALFGRTEVAEDDLRAGVELVLAPRATQFPEEAAPDTPPPEPPAENAPPPPEAEAPDKSEPEPAIPEEILVEAARALLPDDLLERAAAARQAARMAAGSGAGAARRGNRRGRPLPARPGLPRGEARIDLAATLRQAAPWQRIRRASRPQGEGPPILIRTSDIRLRRFEDRSDRLILFAVDASGSAAFARLAEAKGAVELLLAQAYARRDHVALLAFGGRGADLLLPPTRSLVQTKRRLAALPGGGGTPLAAGLMLAAEVAVQARSRGMSPVVALLTDGRANIALDQRADRVAAAADAERAARILRASSVPGIVIDMGRRPEATLADLARTMASPYLALPRADAARLSGAIGAALPA